MDNTDSYDDLAGEVERLKMICLSLRDAVVEYHYTGEQSGYDEVNRIAEMCNDGSLLEDIPYVKATVDIVVEYKTRNLELHLRIRDNEIDELKHELARLRATNKTRLTTYHKTSAQKPSNKESPPTAPTHISQGLIHNQFPGKPDDNTPKPE